MHVEIVIEDYRSTNVLLQVHMAVQYCSVGLARQRSGEEWRFGATFLSLESNDDWSRGAQYIPLLMKQIIGKPHSNRPKEGQRWKGMEGQGHIYLYKFIFIHYIYIFIYLILYIYMCVCV
jgi:hypothetical protein